MNRRAFLRASPIATFVLGACGGGLGEQIVGAAIPSAEAAQQDRPRLHTVRDTLSTSVPIIDHTDQSRAVILYNMNVRSEILASSLPVLIGQFSVTNTYPYTVGVGYGIWDGDTHEWICPPVMDNVSQDRHHMPVNFSAVDTRGVARDVNYQLVVYAASSVAGGGHALVVDAPGYGFLQCMVV